MICIVCLIFATAQATFLNLKEIPRCSSSGDHQKHGDLAGILGKIIKALQSKVRQPEARPMGLQPPPSYQRSFSAGGHSSGSITSTFGQEDALFDYDPIGTNLNAKGPARNSLSSN